MNAFAAAIEMLFADPNIGVEAIYTSDGGAPVLVRVVARRADAVTEFGDARLWSETTRVDVRVADAPNPRPGDRIDIEGEAQTIVGRQL
jgi:hypothetical protein